MSRAQAGRTAAEPRRHRLGAGGEAEVFAVEGRPSLAEKRYRVPSPARERKLRVMLAHPPEQESTASLAWPVELVHEGSHVVGFLMPRVDVARSAPLFSVYNPAQRRKQAPGWDWRYLVRTARNVATIVDAVHRAGYVIGDLNESNLLVSSRATVTLVDCDSLQVRDPATGDIHRCLVGKVDFLAPELQGADLSAVDRTTASDDFALAVLVFLMLMEGMHPYAGVWQGRGEPPDLAARMRGRRFPYSRASRLTPPPLALPLRVLPREVRGLVRRAFVVGAARPSSRPSAAMWMAALDRMEAELLVCARSVAHTYPRHLRRCPWCARIAVGLPDPFPRAGGNAVGPPPLTAGEAARVRSRAAVGRVRSAVGAAGSKFGSRCHLPAWAVVAGGAGWLEPLRAPAVVTLVTLAFVVVRASGVEPAGRWWSPARWWRRTSSVVEVARRMAVDVGWLVAAAAGPVAVAATVVRPELAGAIAATIAACFPATVKRWRSPVVDARR